MQGATVQSAGLVPPAAAKVVKTRKNPNKEDSEMRAMKRVSAALESLSQAAALRVLRWSLGRVEDRGYVESIAPHPALSGEPRPLGGDQPR